MEDELPQARNNLKIEFEFEAIRIPAANNVSLPYLRIDLEIPL